MTNKNTRFAAHSIKWRELFNKKAPSTDGAFQNSYLKLPTNQRAANFIHRTAETY